MHKKLVLEAIPLNLLYLVYYETKVKKEVLYVLRNKLFMNIKY